MHRLTFVLLSCALCLTPALAGATTWQRLDDDTKAWQQALNADVQDTSLEQADSVWQSASDLFPVSKTAAAPQGSLESKRDARTKAFLSVLVGKKVVVFTDVSKSSWAAPYIRSAVENGFFAGYRDSADQPIGKFGPEDPVTVEQMAKVLTLATQTTTANCPAMPRNLTASGSSWSKPYVSCAEMAHWSVYDDASVDVRRPAMRSEVVVSILQAFHVSIAQAGTGAVVIFKDVAPTQQFSQYILRAKTDHVVNGYTDADGNPTGMFGPGDPVTRAAFAKMLTIALETYVKP